MKRISIWTIILLCILLPINIYALDFDIYSKNVILYNTKENKVVYEKNSKEKISIASLTKITTGIVAIENIKDLDEKVTITNDDFKGLYEANAALAGFRVGEEVTYRDLLYGLMLPSGAEAARALERNVAGSEEAFIKLMNNKAKELKLENTHYANPTGLDDPNHYSTANDVLTVFKYALSNKDFKEIVTAKKYTTSDKSITFRSTLSKLSGLDMDYVLGGKTGTTEDAGLCLATLANYDDTDFILVTAKAEYSRTSPRNFLDQKEIYEYVRDNYDYMEVDEKPYYPQNTEGNSLFLIDVVALDKDIPVKAETTAMSTPHTIEYTLHFSSETATQSTDNGIPTTVFLGVGAVIIAIAFAKNFRHKGKKHEVTEPV